MWHAVGGEGENILSKFQLPSFYGLWIMLFEDLEEKVDWQTDSLTDYKWITKLLVEQPRLHRVCLRVTGLELDLNRAWVEPELALNWT